ncbi:MAG: family transporter [Betaproteobacteria bacterium]|nr:family transporter [Betaproteobacteria bacterium]
MGEGRESVRRQAGVIASASALALLAAVCFGAALIVAHYGLQHASSYAGARISLSTTFVLWWMLSPFLLDVSAWHLGAAAIFAVVGVFYPAAVTVLTNESNRLLGPTLTGTVSSSAPLFATGLAVVVLGEELTPQIVIGGLTIVAALALMSWRRSTAAPAGWRLLLPLSGAALRGLAQTLGKLGLTMWPNPFAATLIGYTVSAAGIWGYGLTRPRGAPQPLQKAAVPWFMAAGVLNGSALLLLYHALHVGRVSLVAPLVALYPIFTLLYSALFLRTEVLTRRLVLGALLAVAGVAVLVSG